MKRKRLLAVTLILGLGVFIAGCGSKQTTTEEIKPIAVKVSNVLRTTVESVVTVNGKVRPVKDVNVAAKASGRVEKVFFEIGERVSEGDLLFRLEQNDIKLQLSQAEAALSIAKSSYEKTKGGMLEQQMVQLEAAYESAKTNYENAKLNYERTKQLYEVDGVSKAAFEAAQSSYKLAEEQYKTAKASYELTKNKINPENIQSSKAQLEQAHAAYELAKSQFDNTMVRSPISGRVGTKDVKAGETISPAVTAMNISDLSSCIVEVGVTEDVINKIKPGDKVKVNVDAISDVTFEGEVKNLSPVADAKTQSYKVRIEIDNEGGLLKGGMFAQIKMVVDKAENVLAAPLKSIIDDGGKKYVYVIEGDKSKRKDINIGYSNDEVVQILDGLKDNETIVIEGQSYLQEGSKVKVVK